MRGARGGRLTRGRQGFQHQPRLEQVRRNPSHERIRVTRERIRVIRENPSHGSSCRLRHSKRVCAAFPWRCRPQAGLRQPAGARAAERAWRLAPSQRSGAALCGLSRPPPPGQQHWTRGVRAPVAAGLSGRAGEGLGCCERRPRSCLTSRLARRERRPGGACRGLRGARGGTAACACGGRGRARASDAGCVKGWRVWA